MRKEIVLAGLCVLLAACGGQPKGNQQGAGADSTATTGVVDMHNAENALDYVGTYEGVFPAADCPGIETTLTINGDKTFVVHYSYLERNTSFEEKGTYTLEGNLLTLKDEKGGTSYYKVEENKVRRLNGDKSVVTGDLADYYVLTKK